MTKGNPGSQDKGSVSSSSSLSAKRGEKVLVAADDVRVLDLIQITLTGRGFQVITAQNGDEALTRVTNARPSLAVIDTKLPRKSGLEVLEEIRKTRDSRQLPVILISSKASSEAKLEGFRKGADDYVAKPFSPRELILRIRRILDRIEEAESLATRVRRLEGNVQRGEKALDEVRTDLRSRLFRYGSVVSALQALGRATSRDELAERFVRTAVGYLELGPAALFVRDGDRYVSRVVRGAGSHRDDALVLSRSGVAAETLTRTGRPLAVESVATLPEASREMAPILATGIRYLYPVLVGGALEGAVAVGKRPAAEAGPGNDLVAAVAQAVSVALANQDALSAMQRSFLETSSILIRNLEAQHPGLAGHSDRVADLSVRLGGAAGLGAGRVEEIHLAAQLHDLGLVDLYETIAKRRTLDDESRKQLAEAPVRAAGRVSGVGPLEAVAGIIRHHHERWDGTGYPDQLGEASIPVGARIVAIANAFDALTHERPHRPPYGIEEAVEILRSERGAQFDPDLVNAFVRLVENGEVAAA